MIFDLEIQYSQPSTLQVLQKLKDNESFKSIPVFMLSAIDDDFLRDKCIRHGAKGVMLKPFDLDSIENCLSQVLPTFCKRKQAKLGGANISASVASSSVSSIPSVNAASAIQVNGSDSSIGRGRRVLVVDDSYISSAIAQRSLQQSGFVCDTAQNGLEAIKKLQNAKTGTYFFLYRTFSEYLFLCLWFFFLLLCCFLLCLRLHSYRVIHFLAVSQHFHLMRSLSKYLFDCHAQSSAR